MVVVKTCFDDDLIVVVVVCAVDGVWPLMKVVERMVDLCFHPYSFR